MLRKSSLAFVALLSLFSFGCRTPYGSGGCAGGCCGGSCAAGVPAGGAYAPAPPTYAPSTGQYQQAMPPTYGGGGGSGSR